MYPKTKLLNATTCVKGNLLSHSLSKKRGPDPPRRCRRKKKEKGEILLVDHPGGDVVTMPSFLQVYGKE